MQHNERGPVAHKSSPMPEAVVKGSEKSQEKPWIEKVGTTLADIVRDIDTASKMAEDTFDGDSALMRAARGTVSIALGAGMEKVTDMMWEGIWSGRENFIERFKLPPNTGTQLNSYAASAEGPYYLKARLANFSKEGTQDLVIGAINNMIAFRSQPILQKVEATHLLRSLAIDAGQAFVTPSLGKTEHDKASQIVQAPLDKSVVDAAAAVGAGERVGRNIMVSILNLSNPVTHLGIDMVWSGLDELKKNWKEVRKVRKEKGIEGKRVEMTKSGDWRNRGSSNEYRGKYENNGKWQGNKDKVYYGKSNWKSADQKAQEEYELKAGS